MALQSNSNPEPPAHAKLIKESKGKKKVLLFHFIFPCFSQRRVLPGEAEDAKGSLDKSLVNLENEQGQSTPSPACCTMTMTIWSQIGHQSLQKVSEIILKPC